MSEVKQEVRQFYDEVGWKLVGDECYQNARYEDLRPVSQRYVHDCHMRVKEHLNPNGDMLLDAGSGPVQYVEYLEYSRGYRRRVCADISFTALEEARRRLGEHGLYVVADVANLPFKPESFDGIVSLHTIHHLPEEEHLQAFREIYRLLKPQASAVVVNGWSISPLMNVFEPVVRLANWIRYIYYRLARKSALQDDTDDQSKQQAGIKRANKRALREENGTPKGTFTSKQDAAWIKAEIGAFIPVEILVWRSLTVRFMRALIHPWLAGRFWLRWIYRLEERFPHYFGENGKYPLIVIRKSARQE
jgi:hypothetical protein